MEHSREFCHWSVTWSQAWYNIIQLFPNQGNFTLRDKAKQSLTVQEGQKEFMRFAPTYLEVEKDEVRAVVVGRPTPEDLMLEIDVNLIIEFYSH